MQNGAVAEVAVFAEEFAMVGGDRDVGVLRNDIEQLFHDSIEVFDGLDLAVSQVIERLLIEKFVLRLNELTANDMVVKVFEYAMNAADARPVLGRLVG